MSKLNRNTLELDTGVAVSVISHEEYTTEISASMQVPLKETDLLQHTYTRGTVKPLGVCLVKAEHYDQQKRLKLHVLPGKGPALFERELLQAINLIKLQWFSSI